MLNRMLRRGGFGALVALLVWVGVLAKAAQAPAAPLSFSDSRGSFELVTYNVAGLPEGISRSRPRTNLPRIGELLNGFDIALVQEDFAYPLELRRMIRHRHASAAFERGARLDFGDGLSLFSRLPFTDFRRQPWSSCNGIIDSFFDCLTPKGYTLAHQELAPDVFVHIYNLHMDAGGSMDDRSAREQQVEQLIAAIAGESPGRAVIVGGDTNLFGQDHPLLRRLLRETGLSDACTTTRCPEPGRVDRVLYRGSAELELTPRRWRIASEFVDQARRPLSDHLAVAVEFVWHRAANTHGAPSPG
jgi:endonuclease/exonuclease/phosphatase family metal-dependent hydrolase